MKMMTADYAGKQFDIVFDIVHTDTSGNSLQKDTRGCLAQRDCGGKDYDCDDERYEGVCVKAP